MNNEGNMKKEKKVAHTIDAAIITFLKETKDGKFAKIDRNSDKYSRFTVRRQQLEIEDNYLYGVR
jgi:hypothetical protein